MPRKIHNPSTTEVFINFILLNDGHQFIESPKDWIKFHSKAIKYLHRLRSEGKNAYKLMVAFLESHKEANQEIDSHKNDEMRTLAKKKSSQLLDLRLWAIAYYLHRKANPQLAKTIYKKTVAHEIREKLIAAYPHLKPQNADFSAGGHLIPKVTTITTEWLKNI